MRIERPRDALLVVDLQHDFLPGGALAVREGDAVVAPLARLAPAFATVVATQDFHPGGHVSFASAHPGKKAFETIALPSGTQELWPDHCVQGTRGAALHPGLPDAALEFTLPYRRAVAAVVRKWRPEVILAPLYEDAHPDHVVAGRLAESAFFEARLRKIAEGEDPWYTRLLFFYPCRTYRHPTLVVDVSEVYPIKLRAMNAHRSQAPSRAFRAAGYNDVFASVEVRDRFFGGLIGRPYGEGLVATGPLPVTATDQLFFKGCP